jgi:hypothetical protein
MFAVCCVTALAGCGADRFEPRLRNPTSPGIEAFERQFVANRKLPPARCRPVTVLVMLPTYDVIEKIRRGNMGHAAIDVDGRLYDIGALNGYAYTLRAAPGVRFWNFPDADDALRALAGRADADGHLDRILRFDVTVTDEQADRLHEWWAALQRRIACSPDNRLYLWSDLQCASAVSRSLRDAGVTRHAVLSPDDLADHLSRRLRHTAGPLAGRCARRVVVQRGHGPVSAPGTLRQIGTIVFRFPRLFAAGERTKLTLDAPDGRRESLLWSGSRAYARRVATFAIPPAQAVNRALGRGHAWGAQPVPNFLVGRWYHVATDHVIGQAAVGGLYVHGDTGEVLRRDDPRVIQFDTFAGDRVVTPQGSWTPKLASRGPFAQARPPTPPLAAGTSLWYNAASPVCWSRSCSFNANVAFRPWDTPSCAAEANAPRLPWFHSSPPAPASAVRARRRYRARTSTPSATCRAARFTASSRGCPPTGAWRSAGRKRPTPSWPSRGRPSAGWSPWVTWPAGTTRVTPPPPTSTAPWSSGSAPSSTGTTTWSAGRKAPGR